MKDLFISWDEHLIPFYKRFPLAFEKGEGHVLFATDGRKYIDFTSGIAVVNLGHARREVNEAIIEQVNRMSHVSNLFYIPGQAELSTLITSKSFYGRSFFCNSGAEANEAALKMARFIGNQKRQGKNRVLALEGSFHGRTVATITMTGQDKYKKGFDPLLPAVDFVDFNSLESLRSQFSEDVCAIFLEAVQGEGGVRPLSWEFVKLAQELAKKNNALIIFDEIQAGIGRTGKYFGYQWYDIQPDMITLAKGLGNGFPVGAVHVRPEIADYFSSGFHASTFGGNTVAMAAGIAVMKLLTPELMDSVNRLSHYLMDKLEQLQQKFPEKIAEVRGRGLLIGVDLKGVAVGDVINQLIDEGILTLRAGDNVLRLAPPFTITEKEIDLLVDHLSRILS